MLLNKKAASGKLQARELWYLHSRIILSKAFVSTPCQVSPSDKGTRKFGFSWYKLQATFSELCEIFGEVFELRGHGTCSGTVSNVIMLGNLLYELTMMSLKCHDSCQCLIWNNSHRVWLLRGHQSRREWRTTPDAPFVSWTLAALVVDLPARNNDVIRRLEMQKLKLRGKFCILNSFWFLRFGAFDVKQNLSCVFSIFQNVQAELEASG